jgi:RimJ/RimL family protein N-acetyltransferase
MKPDWWVDRIERLANQPANQEAFGYTDLEFSRFFQRPGNVCLGDNRGVALFCETDPGVYEGHYVFDCATRGKAALTLARELIDRLFTDYSAKAIVGVIPVHNRASRYLTCSLGFAPLGTSVGQDGRSRAKYIMERDQWAKLSAGW